jgi:Aldo/keto reductases, related to diketogulonate reductase
VSNYSAGQIDELIEVTGETPAVNQIEWSPSLYNERRLELHQERGVVLEGYSPFKSTNLRHPALVEVADVHGVTPAQVVLRWHVQHGVVVIPKSANLVRLAENFDVFNFSLRADEMVEIDSMSLH